MSNYSGNAKPAPASQTITGPSSFSSKSLVPAQGFVSPPKSITYIMKAKVIADGSYKRWTVYGTPDTAGAYAPVSANLLTDIGVDSIL